MPTNLAWGKTAQLHWTRAFSGDTAVLISLKVPPAGRVAAQHLQARLRYILGGGGSSLSVVRTSEFST